MSVKVNGVGAANDYIWTTVIGPVHLAVVPWHWLCMWTVSKSHLVSVPPEDKILAESPGQFAPMPLFSTHIPYYVIISRSMTIK